MDLNLKGRRAVVSGSTGGIGYATARELSAMGAVVAINGRTQARVDAAIKTLKAETGGEFLSAPGDLSNAKGAADVIRAVPDCDILVNNAAIFEPKPFFDIPDEDWLRFFETNVLSGIRLARHYTPKMVARGWGRVVFISSESALHIPAEMIHYGMTKTAQIAVARGLAETVAGTGVTVNSVLPGPTLSEGVGDFMKKMAKGVANPDLEQMGKDFIAAHRSTSLIKRLATTEEVANMIAYVCSPAASATTGAALRCDGGVVRAIP
ncbi:MAG: SDR family oxidoreductase [Alphaproteobacteria bacterium]|nr:SDR family oxidoreductase [Alphaproteobacteria bacterium]